MRRFTTAVSAVALSLALAGGAAIAADYGTAEEAKEMLNAALPAMKQDEQGTIKKTNSGEIKDQVSALFTGPDGCRLVCSGNRCRIVC